MSDGLDADVGRHDDGSYVAIQAKGGLGTALGNARQQALQCVCGVTQRRDCGRRADKQRLSFSFRAGQAQ